jgi:hypothetical protein
MRFDFPKSTVHPTTEVGTAKVQRVIQTVVVSAGGKVEQEDVCKFCTQSLKMILIVLTQTPAPIVFYNAERSVMLEG